MHVKKNRTTSAGKSGIASHVKTVAAVSALLVALHSAASIAQCAMFSGEVKKIDEAQSKITLKHGPIKNLDMDEEGMTMVFRVQDPSALKQVKIGDKVKFAADRVNGQVT
jgi:Cu(I)/Ag(I) efflux system protein CusF